MRNLVKILLVVLAFLPFLIGQDASARSHNSAAKTPSTTGNDISYPQCNKQLPTGQAFGIVGVNGGVANNTNSCLANELNWANQSTGTTSQAKVQLYVNTANPGGLNTQSWPRSNIDPSGKLTLNPYGSCDGSDSMPCAWQYGWNRALEDVEQRFPPAALLVGLSTDPKAYAWWLDVETMNTWKSGSEFALASNAADLEGMVAYFKVKETFVGIYSTAYQWNQIVGTVNKSSSLNGLDNWRAGARTLSRAKSNCNLAPLTTGGRVVLAQYVSNNLDYDYSCIN